MVDELDTPIVSINFHSEALLVPLLSSLRKEFPTQVVVDNSGTFPASTDLQVIRPGRNLGFGAACNLGVASVHAPRVVLVNPDVVIDGPGLLRLVGGLDAQDRPGLIAPVIHRGDRWISHGYHRPSVARELLSVTGVARRLNSMRRSSPPTPGRDLSRITSTFPTGAVLAVDVAAFRAVHGFDEDYFLYVEDCDLAERLRVARREIAVDTSVVAEHLGAQGSAGSSSVREVLRRVGVQLFSETHQGDTWRWIRRLHTPMVRSLAADGSPTAAFVLERWRARDTPRVVATSVAAALRSGDLEVR